MLEATSDRCGLAAAACRNARMTTRSLLHSGQALAAHVTDKDPGIALQAAVVQVAADHGVLGRGQVPGRHTQPIGTGRQARQDGPLRGLGDRGDASQLLLSSDADVGDAHGGRAHQDDIDQAFHCCGCGHVSFHQPDQTTSATAAAAKTAVDLQDITAHTINGASAKSVSGATLDRAATSTAAQKANHKAAA